MRRLLSVSILALSLAMATAAAGEEWFRLNISPTVTFGGGGGEVEPPPTPGENNAIEIVIDQDEVDARVYGSMTIPVTVFGIDGTYTVSVVNVTGATWVGDTEVYGKGSVVWPSATEGAHRPTVEVRNAGGVVVATVEIKIVVHPPLTADVSETIHEVEVGDDLTILPTTTNAIGDIQWGSTPSELPEWLEFNPATGAIAVDTSGVNTLPEITLTAVDQADLTSASTLPFSIAVKGIETDYWVATLAEASGSRANALAAGPDGSVYVTGQTSGGGAGGMDAVVAKYALTGDLLWKQTLGAANQDVGNSISVGTDGSVYIVGTTFGTGAGERDFLVTKYSASGHLVWSKTLGGASVEQGYGIAVAPDGSVYVTGFTNSAGAGSSDLVLAKYTAAGELAWQKALGGTSSDRGNGISVAADGSVYIVGQTSSAGSDNGMLIAKYTATGNLTWKRSIRAAQGNAISVAPNGAVYATGSNANNLLVVKYNDKGEVSWQRAFTAAVGVGQFVASGISAAADGSVYVTGYASSVGNKSILVAKYTQTGALSWQKRLIGDGQGEGYGISVGSDGAVYVAGQTAVEGIANLFVARLPLDGGEDMVADGFTWSEPYAINSFDPDYSQGFNPVLTHTPNPGLANGTNPLLISGDGAALTNTTTVFVEE